MSRRYREPISNLDYASKKSGELAAFSLKHKCFQDMVTLAIAALPENAAFEAIENFEGISRISEDA